MSSEPSASTSLAEPNIRFSASGTAFDTAILREFARAALRQPAVADEVTRLQYEHVAGGMTTPQQLGEKLPPILEEALSTLTDLDWQMIACDLIADMESVLEVRPLPALPEGDEEMAAFLQRRIHEGSQSADELRARAAELRAQATAFADILGIRDASLALADRYELAARERS